MDPIKLVFRGSLLLCLLSVNSLCAVLYVEIGALDDGGGFFSLSPLIDCIVWGVLIALSVLAAFLTRKSAKEHPLHIPEPLRFPAAYLATLAGLTVLILLLGLSGLLYEYNKVHLPLWGYVGLMTALYLSCGFFLGRRWGSSWKSAVLWGLLLTALLALMGFLVLWNARLDEAMHVESQNPDYKTKSLRNPNPDTLQSNWPAGLASDSSASKFQHDVTHGTTHGHIAEHQKSGTQMACFGTRHWISGLRPLLSPTIQ